MSKKILLLFLCIFIFVIGIMVGFLSQSFIPNNIPLFSGVIPTTKQCAYHYINPLRCEPDLAENKKEYVGLRNNLIKYLNEEKTKGTIIDAAIYFRDLENGPSVNINDQVSFTPASLLKLPLMMSYYRKAQDDPRLLDKKITIPSNMQVMMQDVQPKQTAKVDATYSINDLITLMITQSDNVSWQVLVLYLEKNYPNQDFISTLNDLGIVDPSLSTNGQLITVQSYASIFRLLYNSSYLNIPMSNKALKLLTQADFQDGIIAGLPQGIQVAHKFGERENGDDQQLHDCGIVYYLPNPYILCVMTRGHNLSQLAPVIQNISQMVFEEVKSRN